MFKKILYTTDGSDFAEKALPVALSLAKGQGAQLRIVTAVNAVDTVVFPGAAAMTSSDLYQSMKEELEKAAQAALDRTVAEAEKAGVEVSSAMRHGYPAEEVLAEMREWEADLLVMSTHGRTGLPRLLMGSVANEILHRTTCPVMLCPQRDGDEG